MSPSAGSICKAPMCNIYPDLWETMGQLWEYLKITLGAVWDPRLEVPLKPPTADYVTLYKSIYHSEPQFKHLKCEGNN